MSFKRCAINFDGAWETFMVMTRRSVAQTYRTNRLRCVLYLPGCARGAFHRNMKLTANLESKHVYGQKVGGTNISDKPVVASYVSQAAPAAPFTGT